MLKEDKSIEILASLTLALVDGSLPGKSDDLKAAAEIDPNAPLDAYGRTLVRKEQGFLRRQLFGANKQRTCMLCGSLLPTVLLIAAHIKKRSVCSHAERLDYANNVVPMCKLGCDALFARGYLHIVNGVVALNPSRESGLTPALSYRLADFLGRTVDAHSVTRAAYFAWHREYHG